LEAILRGKTLLATKGKNVGMKNEKVNNCKYPKLRKKRVREETLGV